MCTSHTYYTAVQLYISVLGMQYQLGRIVLMPLSSISVSNKQYLAKQACGTVQLFKGFLPQLCTPSR